MGRYLSVTRAASCWCLQALFARFLVGRGESAAVVGRGGRLHEQGYDTGQRVEQVLSEDARGAVVKGGMKCGVRVKDEAAPAKTTASSRNRRLHLVFVTVIHCASSEAGAEALRPYSPTNRLTKPMRLCTCPP